MEPTMVSQKKSIEGSPVPAAILWTPTVLAWGAAGVLVLATFLLALVGRLSAWWLEPRHLQLPGAGDRVSRPPRSRGDGRPPLPDTAAAYGPWLDAARTP